MRYAVLSDIHANSHALAAVDEEVRRLRTAEERPLLYWFLGDIIGYGPEPVECLRWLKNKAHIDGRWLPGNHDEWLINGGEVHPDAQASLEKHRAILTSTEHESLGHWFTAEVSQAIDQENRSLVIETAGELTILFVHASTMLSQRRGTYLFPWKPALIEEEFLRLSQVIGRPTETVLLLCGHTHFPMWAWQQGDSGCCFQSIGYDRPLPLKPGLNIINPGSVGQPRDGDWRAAYAILDLAGQTIEFRRVNYPVHVAAAALTNKHYPKSLVERLLSANGQVSLQEYYTLYRRPQWDLEAIQHG